MNNYNFDGVPFDYWYKIYEYRSDLSSGVIHLTKPYAQDINFIKSQLNSLDNKTITELHKMSVNRLMDILIDEVIVGGKGFITGDIRAACFQDVPLKSLKENINFN